LKISSGSWSDLVDFIGDSFDEIFLELALIGVNLIYEFVFGVLGDEAS